MGRRACAERKEFNIKSADPCVGRVRSLKFFLPPTPSALGPSPPTPRPNRRKNTLYVYWVHFLAHGVQILPRGIQAPFGSNFGYFESFGPILFIAGGSTSFIKLGPKIIF